MQHLAHFLVKCHKLIFIAALAITVVSLCLMPFVTVNKDMTKYIPSYMQSKVGMDLMSQEFGDASQFRLMFEDVPAAEQAGIATKLETVPGVTSVSYDDSSAYHSGKYTLYEVAVTGGTYSSDALQAYDDLQKFAEGTGYTCHFDSAVIDAALPNLGLIIGCGTAILIIILTAMSKAWFEPVLLLATLGIAILMNMGTNVIFESVSDTTFSIAAIFQLVLSLDYSVMLMSRYRDERKETDDVHLAMERALRNAFGSITSSSLTTVVGMVCLVLMSFTIGRDMGLVLAKGVVFSLLCVFTIMPTLVMAFDKVLQKTAKKSFHPAMARWSAVSHRGRIPLLIAFLLLFGGGFALRGLAEASFVLPSLNADHQLVESVFPAGSQVIVLYDDDDEEAVAGIVDDIKAMDGVISVNSYASTLGKQYTADQLAEQMGMDSTFIKLLYYYAENGANVRPMTVNQFAALIQDDIAANPSFADQVKDYDLGQIGLLRTLTDTGTITQQRTAAQMTSFLGSLGSYSSGFDITESQMQQLYLLYYLQSPSAPAVDTGTMTMGEFLDFLVNDVAKNEQFASQFDPETLAQLKQLQTYVNIAVAVTAIPTADIAAVLGITEEELLDFVQRARTLIDELLDYLKRAAEESPAIREIITPEEVDTIKKALSLVDTAVARQELSSQEIASLLGMDASQAEQLYRLKAYNSGGQYTWTMSAYDLMTFLCSDTAKSAMGSALSDEAAAGITAMQSLMAGAVAGTAYYPAEMAATLANVASAAGAGQMASTMTANSLTLLYLYRDSRDLGRSTQTMSIEEFVTFIAENILDNPLFSPFISDDMRTQIADALEQIKAGKSSLLGSSWNRLIIKSSFAAESDEMSAFVSDLRALMDNTVSNPYYLVGEGPMIVDMRADFMDELDFITLVTAAAIFLIVLLTFRNFLIPLILVAMIQSSFFWTMVLNGLAGSPMYYVAIIIVQAILMGATIDYAILYTSQYREHRTTMGIRNAIAASYHGSISTMLTSGSILVMVTFILGMAMEGTAVGGICLTIAEGSALALLLVMFVLPGVLAALDRFVAGKGRLVEEQGADDIRGAHARHCEPEAESAGQE